MANNFTSWPTISALKKHRVAKYKQRRQIMTRPLLQAMPNIQIGGCTGLSFAWIQRHQKMPSETSSDRIKYLDTDQAWSNVDYFASVFNNLPAKDYATRIAEIAPHSCGMKKGSSVIEKDFSGFSTAIKHLNDNPGYHVVMMCLTPVKTNHVCGAWSGSGGIVFFDPNSGEYKVTKKQTQDLFKSLVLQYASYVSAKGIKTSIKFSEIQFHHIG